MRWLNRNRNRKGAHHNSTTLATALINKEYKVKGVSTDNHEIRDFLFTLGCYHGEKITVISTLAGHYVVVIKDARYSIDKDLAECIIVE